MLSGPEPLKKDDHPCLPTPPSPQKQHQQAPSQLCARWETADGNHQRKPWDEELHLPGHSWRVGGGCRSDPGDTDPPSRRDTQARLPRSKLRRGGMLVVKGMPDIEASRPSKGALEAARNRNMPCGPEVPGGARRHFLSRPHRGVCSEASPLETDWESEDGAGGRRAEPRGLCWPR